MALTTARALVNNEPRDAPIAELLSISRPILGQSATRSSPGARPSPRRRRRPSRPGPGGQGAAAALPLIRAVSSNQEAGCMPVGVCVPDRQRRQHQNNTSDVTKAGRSIRALKERVDNPFCLFHRRRSHNTSECWELKRIREDVRGTHEGSDPNRNLADGQQPPRGKAPRWQQDHPCSADRPSPTVQTTSRSSWTVEIVSTSSLSLSVTRHMYTR